MSPSSLRKVGVSNLSDPGANQALHLASNSLAHAPDLAIPPLMDSDPKSGLGDPSNFGRRSGTVFEVDSPTELGNGSVRYFSICVDQILLFYTVGGMGDQICKITIVGEYQQPLTFVVQPAYGIDAS